MAHIVVVTHEFDTFTRRRRFWKRPTSSYLLFDILQAATALGHSWQVSRGLRPVRGDVAILHVDSTRVAPDYLALGAAYSLALNFAVADISKRRISGASLGRTNNWSGPVIIKSDLNCGGWPEEAQNRQAARRFRPKPYPHLGGIFSYYTLPSAEAVPDAVWRDPTRVIERFIPEPAGESFALHTWVFMGERERCTRHVSREPINKAAGAISRTPAEVPAAIRRERTRLGFDYGKFDFVIEHGVPVLLDANRTPGTSATLREFLREGNRNLAEGLDMLIRPRLDGGR